MHSIPILSSMKHLKVVAFESSCIFWKNRSVSYFCNYSVIKGSRLGILTVFLFVFCLFASNNY